MSPKLRPFLARAVLLGGVACLATFVGGRAPREQTIAVRLGNREVRHVDGVLTREGDDQATAGFSRDFPAGCPRTLRHTFSAPNATYIVVITLKEGPAGDTGPIPPETTFERRVSLAGGEVIVSPD